MTDTGQVESAGGKIEVGGVPGAEFSTLPRAEGTSGAPPLSPPVAPDNDGFLVEFAFFPKAASTSAAPLVAPWSEWVGHLTKHETRGSAWDTDDEKKLDGQKDGPCVVLGAIAAGESHTNKAVKHATALGLDLDHVTQDEVNSVIRAIAQWEYVGYSTHKHGAVCADKDPARRNRVRIVLPVHIPMTPHEHAQAWASLNAIVYQLTDPKTRNIGRLFYLPSTFDARLATAWRNRGELVTLGALRKVALGAAAKIGSAIAGEEQHVTSAQRLKEARAIRQALRRVEESEITDKGIRIQPIAEAALTGRPLAEDGKRHEAALAVTMYLATYMRSKVSSAAIADVFAPSVAAALREDPNANGIDDVVKAYTGAIANLGDWDKRQREEKREEASDEAVERQLLKAGVDSEYTEADLARIAKAAGVPADPGQEMDALRHRWIIQASANCFYLLGRDGRYQGPYDASSGRTAAVSILGPAGNLVRMNEYTPQRTIRRRPLAELAEDHGSAAKMIVADLTRQRGFYDPETATFYEAVRPLRTDLRPHFDGLVDEWLKLFAGDFYPKLCAWMACCPDTTKLLCALYIVGDPGSGKTLFATGMGALWNESPGDLGLAMGDFNSEIARNPLLLADEEIPRVRGKSVTAQLRSLLSMENRTLTRKFLPPAQFIGACRLVIAANSDGLLRTSEALNKQDIEALGQRFAYFVASKKAADFLNTIPRETRREWMKRTIAEHALFLHSTLEVAPGKRFWVEGDTTEMHQVLALSTEWSARVMDFIALVLANPKPFLERDDGTMRWGKGRLLVNEKAILAHWNVYYPNTKVEPDQPKIVAALRALSTDDKRVQLRHRGQHIRYRQLNTELLLTAIERAGGDKDRIRAMLHGEDSKALEPKDNITDDLDEVAKKEPV